MRRRAGWVAAVAASALAIVLTVFGIGDDADALANWQALVLGLVQGATELLPISSSGHLILVPWVGDWDFLRENDEFNQTYDVSLHLGTLVAVVAYFWNDLVRLARAWIAAVRRRRIASVDEKIAWLVVVATIPAALVGFFGEGVIAERLGEPWQIAILLAAAGALLWIADRRPESRHMNEIRLRTAIAIGLAQALALIPGVSRSGITITAARFLGLDRDSAARFSFLLLVPITAGAVAYKGTTDVVLGHPPAGWQGPFAVGIIAAAVSAFAAIRFLLGYVRRHDYTLFVVYRLLAAGVVLLLIATGVRDAGF